MGVVRCGNRWIARRWMDSAARIRAPARSAPWRRPRACRRRCRHCRCRRLAAGRCCHRRRKRSAAGPDTAGRRVAQVCRSARNRVCWFSWFLVRDGGRVRRLQDALRARPRSGFSNAAWMDTCGAGGWIRQDAQSSALMCQLCDAKCPFEVERNDGKRNTQMIFARGGYRDGRRDEAGTPCAARCRARAAVTSGNYFLKNASRSALMTSALTAHIPCEKPG